MPKVLVTKPPKPGKAGGLGEKIESTLQRAGAGFADLLYDWIVNVGSDALTLFMEIVEKAVAPRARPLINRILATPDLPPEIRDYLGHLGNPTSQAEMVGLGGFGASIGMGAASAVLAPVFRVINYAMDLGIRSARADPSALFPMVWRGAFEAQEGKKSLKELGWRDEFISAWEEVLRPRFGPAELVRIGHLKDAGFGAAQAEMLLRGYKQGDVNDLEVLSKMVPGPGDLISMAVREAFDDGVAAMWGYDQDFPAEFAKWMKRQGDADGWAQKYWRSHWQMPGLTMALEAFHRLPDFDSQKLDTFLRVSDVAPGWRDIIKRVAYNPLTRVDVRRMYGMGVLDRAAVVKSYLNLGYSPEDAEAMTVFTIKYESNADRELTKADILGGFADGMLSREEAVTYLNSIGYPDNTAQFLVSREDADRARVLTDKQVKSIRTLYVNKDLTDAQARMRLAALNLASTEIDVKLEEWRIDRDAKVKRPTQAQLDTFLLDDIIGVDEYKAGLGALGMQDKYIGWYTAHVLGDKAEAARKAEKAERAEQQSIRDRKVKSDYQVGKAALDVNVAELKTAIAETQIARAGREDRYKLELAVVRGLLPAKELRARADHDIAGFEREVTDIRDAEAILREAIDGFETQVAEINLQLAAQAEGLPALLEAATTDEQATQIAGDAARQELTWRRKIRELELQKEQAQDQIAGLETQVTGLRAIIADRKIVLAQELALAEKVTTEIELTAVYQTDIEVTETRLSTLRLNLADLLESKARLTVEYREALV